MSKRYTYSRSIGQSWGGEQEVFTAVEFDSFDEAKKVVNKAIYERRLELEKEHEELIKEMKKISTGEIRALENFPMQTKSSQTLQGPAPTPKIAEGSGTAGSTATTGQKKEGVV